MSIQILPGTHVDVVAGERATQLVATGIVAMPLQLSWGDKVTALNHGDSTLMALGYDITDPALKCVHEALNGAEKLILYRLNNSGVKATATLAAGITATAKYPGVRGNDLSVVVAASGSDWLIRTLLGTKEIDSQIIAAPADFQAKDFIAISGTGTLAAVTVNLTGGTDGAIDTGAWDDFKAKMELQTWNVLAYTGTDTDVTTDLITWINQLRQNDSRVQMVESAVASNDPAVYHNTIGGTTDSYALTAAEACATLAGLAAKQGIVGSLTHYDSVTGWTDVNPHLTHEQMETRTQAGEILFVLLYGVPAVLYDINSLTTYTKEQPEDFHKGLVMRTLDSVGMNVQKLLDTKAVGKIRNSKLGRPQIKAMVVKLITESYLKPGYIEDFTADDVTIEQSAGDAVTAVLNVKVVDMTDKIQLTVVSLAPVAA